MASSFRQWLTATFGQPGGWSHHRALAAEPALVLRRSLALLRRLNAAGIAVPGDVQAEVLASQHDAMAGCAARGKQPRPGLYEAYRRLSILAARLEDDEPAAELADSFSRAIINSEYLLKFAAENGTAVEASVQTDLLAGQAAFGTRPADEVQQKFYAAYAKLAAQLGEVTADTIKACRSPLTKRRLLSDARKAIAWAVVAVLLSVGLFVAEAIDGQLKEEIASANALAIKIRGTLPPLPAVPAGGGQTGAPHDDCSDITTSPRTGEIAPTQGELEQLQSFAIALRAVRSRAVKLNFFLARWECDPFGICAGYGLDKALETRRHLEIDPEIKNYRAEFLCKVQTWQRVRDFAENTRKSFAATFGGVTANILPILYALLGAYAYRLRRFGETTRNRTFHPSHEDTARLVTAIIAGAVIALFKSMMELSLSPLALAFLVGYGVETFFRFLDSMLGTKFARSGTDSGKPQAPAAGNT